LLPADFGITLQLSSITEVEHIRSTPMEKCRQTDSKEDTNMSAKHYSTEEKEKILEPLGLR